MPSTVSATTAAALCGFPRLPNWARGFLPRGTFSALRNTCMHDRTAAVTPGPTSLPPAGTATLAVIGGSGRWLLMPTAVMCGLALRWENGIRRQKTSLRLALQRERLDLLELPFLLVERTRISAVVDEIHSSPFRNEKQVWFTNIHRIPRCSVL